MHHSLSAVLRRHEYNINQWIRGETCVCFRDGVVGKNVERGPPPALLTCFSGPFGDARCLFEEVRHRGLPDLQVVGPVGLRRHEK